MIPARMPRVVVVDDDTALAEELAGLFTDVGYEVTGVANAAIEGIDMVEHDQARRRADGRPYARHERDGGRRRAVARSPRRARSAPFGL